MSSTSGTAARGGRLDRPGRGDLFGRQGPPEGDVDVEVDEAGRGEDGGAVEPDGVDGVADGWAKPIAEQARYAPGGGGEGGQGLHRVESTATPRAYMISTWHPSTS
jgi:hypothetical protein